MSNRTKLLLNETEKSDNPVIAKLTIDIRKDGSIDTSLEQGDKDPENMSEKELEDVAKGTIEFFKESLIPRAIRWNIDLGAKENVLRYIIADWIKQCAKLLSASDKGFKELIGDCKRKGNN